MNRCRRRPDCRRTAAAVRAAALMMACALGAMVPAVTPALAAPATTTPTTKPTVARPPAPKADMKSGTGAMSVPIVTTFVRDSLARLSNDDDTDAANVSRQDLVEAAWADGRAKEASPVYLQTYLTELGRDLPKLLSTGSVRTRVNVAIVLAQVSEGALKANLAATQLQPAVLAAINDKVEPVAVWGMRAAADIMTASGANPPAQLLAAIPKSVADHQNSGPIAEEAYLALYDPNPKVIPVMISLFKTRVDSYAKGVPTEPAAEKRAIARLTSASGMWPKLTPAQQAQVMGLVSQTIQQAASAGAAGSASQDVTDQLRSLLINSYGAVWAVTQTSNPTLSNQGLSASKQMANAKPSDWPNIAQPIVAAVAQQFPNNGAAPGAAAGGGTGPVSGSSVAKP